MGLAEPTQLLQGSLVVLACATLCHTLGVCWGGSVQHVPGTSRASCLVLLSLMLCQASQRPGVHGGLQSRSDGGS